MTFKIIKLHGCSGAGKTTVARSLISDSSPVHVITPDGAKNPEAYVCHVDDWGGATVAVLGSYQNNCGGMDTVSSAAKAIEMVAHYSRLSHVFHEGLLQSTYYGEMGKDSERYGDDYIYAFLDTPLLICLERVTRRRDVQGSKNKFNPQNTVDKFNAIERLKIKCTKAGRRVVTIHYDKDPIAQLKAIYLDAS